MINFFFPQNKKFRPTSHNGRFPILRPNLRPLSGIENIFSRNLVTRRAFWGKIYWELSWRWIHCIIISGSRSKVEKTMKNSVFSNFDCDPEIMMKWLQHHGNLRYISPQKTQWSTFFFSQNKKFRPTSQNGRFPILRPNLKPLSEIKNFFLKI